MTTTIDEITRELAGIKTFVQSRVDEGTKPIHDEQVRLAKAMDDVLIKIADWKRERLLALSPDGKLAVREGRLAGFDFLDLAILKAILMGRQGKGGRNHATLLEQIDGVRKDMRGAVTPETILMWQEGAFERRMSLAGPKSHLYKSQVRGELGVLSRQMLQMVTRAALDSTTTSAGDELVPTFEAAELWMDVNLATNVLPLFRQMPMPTNPFDIPSQFGDTNWYPSDENVAVLTTAPTTSKMTLTAYGLKTGVPFSDELEEDAIIALVPELRQNLTRNAAEVIDDVLLNGDTTVTNGINSDGATISKTTAGKAHWLLGFDGLIHLGLQDNTSNDNNANAAVSTALYNTALRMIAKYGVPNRVGEVVFVTDVNTYIASLNITQFTTRDVAAERATLSSGELLNVFGKPLVVSAQMRLADTDGKITDSGNATSTGRILCVNTTQWRVGFRRSITLEPDREPGKGQTTLYVSFRIAFGERTGTRSSADHTSIVRDITGVT